MGSFLCDSSVLLEALDHLEEALVVLDSDRRLVCWNRRYREMWGFDRAFLEARPTIEDCIRRACRTGIYPPEREQELVENRLRQLEARVPKTRLQTPRTDGLAVEGYASPLPGGGWVLSFRDVTELERVLAELQASEALHRTVLESTPDMVVIASRERRIEYVNPALARSLGRRVLGEVCHRTLFGLDRPCPWCSQGGDREAGVSSHTATLQDGRVCDVRSVRLPYPEGNGYTLCVIRDITDRVERERDLQRAVEVIRRVIRAAGDGILVCDRERVCHVWNPVLERWTGIRASRVVGNPLPDVLTGRIRDLVLPEVERALSGVAVQTDRLQYQTRDGGQVWIEASYAPWRDRQGRIDGVVGILRDVTRSEAQERERRRFEENVRRAERLESLGLLAGGIAHDFNNILTPVLAHAEFAKSRVPQGDPVQHHLEEILKGAERAAELARQILAFSRETTGPLRPMDVRPLVKETLKFLRATIPPPVEIRERFEVEEAWAQTDPARFHQILMNLCVNAVQAMPGGGTVEVGLRTAAADQVPARDVPPQASRYIHLWVSDTGPGIAPEILPHIFEPFFTTKGPEGGTGMGLATVRRLVEEHGGVVTVDSAPGRGARFDVFLPLFEGREVVEREAEEEIRRGAESILLLDDDKAVVDLLRYILGDLGYRVAATSDPQEGIHMFQRNPGGFDVVIVDLLMPEVTGVEIIRKVRSLRPEIPVIVCTGHPQPGDVLKDLGPGPIELVPKPLSVKSLSSALKKVLDPSPAN